jgi:hypothetical protein
MKRIFPETLELGRIYEARNYYISFFFPCGALGGELSLVVF